MIMYENINLITCGGVSCYIIRGEKGDVLIDTGREEYRDHIETWLLNYNVTMIILTHGHGEQIQNAGYFSELYNAPIMISPYDMTIARDNSARDHYITNPIGRLMKRRTEMDRQLHMNHFEPKIFAEEGMDLKPYGIDGTIISLEGHTKGSIGILCKSSVGYDLYAGDAVMNVGMPLFPSTSESPLMAKASLEKMITLAPDRILPSHGKPICLGDKFYKLFVEKFN